MHLWEYVHSDDVDMALSSAAGGARAAAERELRKRDRQEALASGRMLPGLEVQCRRKW